MKSLSILIVEDQLIAALDIKETLESSGHRITSIARSYDDAMTSVFLNVPDIAIIDVNLGEASKDGILTAKELKSKYAFPIIFLTGNHELETFKAAKETIPAAYILKPFKQKELSFQIELAYHSFTKEKNTVLDLKKSLDLYLPSVKGLRKIIKSDVVYLKANGSYVNVYLRNETESLIYSMNLSFLAQFFPENFYAISRSYVINLDFAETIDDQKIKLKGFQELIPVPDSKKAALFDILPIVRKG